MIDFMSVFTHGGLVMPIYEFYCGNCHMVFNFLSRRVNTDKRPNCPRCARPDLDRKVSLFAYSLGRPEDSSSDDVFGGLDDEKLERAIGALAGEMDGLDEENPQQMARIMRKLGEATGMTLGDGMEEAISRLESGEAPEAIEQELGDLFENENPFTPKKMHGFKRRLTPPAHDDTLHIL
jgi:putative FmdB family regulatory protein